MYARATIILSRTGITTSPPPKRVKEILEKLQDIAKDIVEEAKNVVKDYEENPSNLDSGSVIVVHESSTLLDNKDEELSDIAYSITRKSSSINVWGDDDWATPKD